MAPKFGTSGLRGLVTDLSDDLVGDYTRAFLAACDTGSGLCIGEDLRPSSPRIAAAVASAARSAGVPVTQCGALPTPALALYAMERGMGAVMVTGSHIPADRNGLKFYLPSGEIDKAAETAISQARGGPNAGLTAAQQEGDGLGPYINRFVTAFGATALSGLRVGVYQHSSVARDAMVTILREIGAEAVPLAWSDEFIPVDTEAVDPATRDQLNGWCTEHGLDALVSTDGDADRPMVADANGRIIPGDVLGPLTARALGADIICTPVSSNTAVEGMGFDAVRRTRIGSPFVIAAMEEVLATDPGARVVGYEANGGLLLGYAAQGPAGALPALMTRDSVLPIVAPLCAACSAGKSLADLAATLPARFTAADRIQGVEPEQGRAFLNELTGSAEARTAFFGQADTGIDLTDGLRVHFADETILHLRPSGNAPEFRCYGEADTAALAEERVAACLANARSRFA